MIEDTAVTQHVHECVKLLNRKLQLRSLDGVSTEDRKRALEAAFELIDNPWDEGSERDKDFREGYEMCLLDVVDAIANEWGIELPRLKVE